MTILISILSRYWKPLVLMAVVAAFATAYHAQKSARYKAEKTLSEYVAKASQEKAARDAENAIKQRIQQQDSARLMQSHQAAIEKIRKDYNARQSRTESAHAADVEHLRDSLQRDIAASAAGLRGVSEATSESAKSGGDCDATSAGYADTVITACKITTEDYNALRQAWDSACDVYGCR